MRAAAEHGFVVTTRAKAKTMRPILEKLVTRAKVQSLASRRMLLAETGDAEVTEQFLRYGKLFTKRPGGYTRMVRIARHQGDNTETVRLEWVEKLAEPVAQERPKAPQGSQREERAAVRKVSSVSRAAKVAPKQVTKSK